MAGAHSPALFSLNPSAQTETPPRRRQVAGLVIAAGCLGLVQFTGNTVWDSVGSLAVAGLLGAVAVVLIQRNRRARAARRRAARRATPRPASFCFAARGPAAACLLNPRLLPCSQEVAHRQVHAC